VGFCPVEDCVNGLGMEEAVFMFSEVGVLGGSIDGACFLAGGSSLRAIVRASS